MNSSICGQISQPTCDAIRKDVRVPVGHVVIAEKWAGSELHIALKSLLQTVVSDHLGLIDFYPSSDSAVLYISEAELLNENAVKRKIVKLRKNNAKRPYVMAEQAAALQEQYNNLQQFAVMELGIPLLAVHNQTEAAQLLAQMEAVESGEKQNPFLVQRRVPPTSSAITACLLKVPGLGEVKARALLQKYRSALTCDKNSFSRFRQRSCSPSTVLPSLRKLFFSFSGLRALSLCSVDELTKVVGPASAASVHRFFNGAK